MKSLRLQVWPVAFTTPPSFAFESDAAAIVAFVDRAGHVTDTGPGPVPIRLVRLEADSGPIAAMPPD